MLRLVSILALGMLLSISCVQHTLAQEMPPAQVSVIEINEQFMAPNVSLKGNVVSLKKGVIASEVAGQIDAISLVGSVLAENGSIATINQDSLNWSLARARANLKSLNADLIFRNSEVERFSSLAKRDNASKTQLQQAIAIRDMLKQSIMIAETDVSQAQKAIARSMVPAPYTGIITEQFVEIGEYVNVGDPIARLVNTSNIEIVVPTPIDYFSVLKNGDELSVIRNSEEQLTLPIRSVVNVGDVQTRMVEVRLNAANTSLIVGESVSVLVPRAVPQLRLAIPRDAVIIRGSQTFVYRAANNMAEQIPISIEFADGEWLAVSGDLNAGNKLIIRGAERLQPGSAIAVLD